MTDKLSKNQDHASSEIPSGTATPPQITGYDSDIRSRVETVDSAKPGNGDHDRHGKKNDSPSVDDESPTITRFGMLPPKITDGTGNSSSIRRVQTSRSPTNGVSFDLDYTSSYSHAPKKTLSQRFREVWRVCLLFSLKVGVLLLGLAVVFGLFVFLFLLYNGGISYFFGGGVPSREDVEVARHPLDDDPARQRPPSAAPSPVSPAVSPPIPFSDLLQQGDWATFSLEDMIDADFGERRTGGLSTDFTPQTGPFGRETIDQAQWNSASERSGLLAPPKTIPLSREKILEITSDARLVYLSGFHGDPWNPTRLRSGAESRLELWIEGVEAELPAAEYLIGLCYRNEICVAPSADNAFKAVLCQKKAAEGGCLPAMYLLADFHLVPHGAVPTDPRAAEEWLEKAADLGEPFSQLRLGGRDDAVAEEKVAWFRKAAQLGLPEAQYRLGQCYENGSGVPRDRGEALRWYRSAAQQQYEPAVAALEDGERIGTD